MRASRDILVIDDEPIVRVCCERSLSLEGYSIDLAQDGLEGLRKLEDNQYGVVLVDIKMPTLGGEEVIKTLKRIAPETRVIVITGYATEEMREKALAMGADLYLEKPFSPKQLLGAIKNVTGEA
ncbi:MAG: response regulator [Nitrospirota bacterium]|jgi:two-component system phosphate regulon sensor histidine kinase PhoR